MLFALYIKKIFKNLSVVIHEHVTWHYKKCKLFSSKTYLGF